MIRSLFIVLLSGISSLFFSSAVPVTTAPPDPDAFSKLFVETIKQNNKDLFVKTFEITEADFNWIVKTFIESRYQSGVEKESIQKSIDKIPEMVKSMYEERQADFITLQEWIEKDTININNIELVDFYYSLTLNKEIPFYIIKKGELIVKHRAKFYSIFVREIVFVNNQWKFERIKSIQEVDSSLAYRFFLKEDYDYPDGDFSPVYDTVKVDSPKYQDYGITLTEKQSKKADKIQKKIDALYEQQNKVIYKEQ